MTAIPAWRASAGLARRSSRPSSSSRPESGRCTPARIFTRVDLPAPFSPIRAWASPAWSSIDPSSRAWTDPKDLVACSRTSSGAIHAPGAGGVESFHFWDGWTIMGRNSHCQGAGLHELVRFRRRYDILGAMRAPATSSSIRDVATRAGVLELVAGRSEEHTSELQSPDHL